MKREVEWSSDALADFGAAIDHIAADNQQAAYLVATRILNTIDLLGDFQTGRQGRVKNTYEKLVQKTSYIVAYTISGEAVYIVRIIHGSRDWPEGEWPAE